MPAIRDQAVIGKGLAIKGEITGTESLFIDGKVEGSINIPNERVTIGQNGRVVARMSATKNVCITAREIVIMGKVTGNVSASDRVDIRAEGTLRGDVITSRISIADGAYITGGVDIHKSEAKTLASVMPAVGAKTA
jgi:cytoskeletal protein CcmA (bactofilin family)